MNRKNLIIASFPIIIFLVLGSVLLVGLSRDDKLPSNLVGKLAPPLPQKFLVGYEAIPKKALSDPNLKIVNFWASWCAPCRAEHPNIEKLANLDLKVFGINLKDNPESATKFLKNLGNPYDGIGTDRNGKIAIDWGVYGVPETFILNKSGRIIYRHPGPITEKILKEKILPVIANLE